MEFDITFAVFSKRGKENGKTKAGRSSEQLLHIHAAKIAICPCFCKLIFNKNFNKRNIDA